MAPFTLSFRRTRSIRTFRFLLALVSLGPILFVGIALHAETPPTCCKTCPSCQQSAANGTRRIGDWKLANTENFCVCCASDLDPAAVGKACESLRGSLAKKWLGEPAAKERWASRCYVVVHPTTESYLHEVGTGGQNTRGSSLVRTEKRQVISRRIDIRGNVADPLGAALPHEMTHVILADAFAGDNLPRWADEGMAMLADPPEKLAGHDHDFDAAVSEHKVFHLSQLLSEQGYPTADRRTVFYGESLSIVRYLVARRTAVDFVKFLHLTAKSGNDASLKEVYGIQDLAQLEHLWRSQSNLALR
jgi:hypothetical protein